MINYNTTANATSRDVTSSCACSAQSEAELAASIAEQASETRCRRARCTGTVLGFLTALMTFAIGLVIGAVFAGFVLISLPAVIVFALILAVLIAVILILNRCMTERRCCCRSDDCCE